MQTAPCGIWPLGVVHAINVSAAPWTRKEFMALTRVRGLLKQKLGSGWGWAGDSLLVELRVQDV